MGFTSKEWQDLTDLIALIHSAETEEGLSNVVVNIAPRVISVDVMHWDEHRGDLNVDRIGITKEYTSTVKKLTDEIAHHFTTHPLFERLSEDIASRQTRKAQGTHDQLTNTRVQDTAIFRDVLSKMEIREQLGYHIYIESDFCVLVTASVRGKFTEASRTKFEILQKHIEIAARRVLLHSRLNRGLDHCGNGMRLSHLSKREREILPLVLQGKSNIEIAIIGGSSSRTVETQVASILEKTGMENRKMLIALFSEVYS